MLTIWSDAHQLAEQVVGLDADGLGEGADGDRRLDLGVRLPGDGQGGALAAAVLAAAAAASGLLLVGEQGGGGDRRGDAAFGGALAPPGAAAGAVGGRAEAGPLVVGPLPLAVVLLLGRAGRVPPGRRDAAWRARSAVRRDGTSGRPAPTAARGAAPSARRGPRLHLGLVQRLSRRTSSAPSSRRGSSTSAGAGPWPGGGARRRAGRMGRCDGGAGAATGGSGRLDGRGPSRRPASPEPPRPAVATAGRGRPPRGPSRVGPARGRADAARRHVLIAAHRLERCATARRGLGWSGRAGWPGPEGRPASGRRHVRAVSMPGMPRERAAGGPAARRAHRPRHPPASATSRAPSAAGGGPDGGRAAAGSLTAAAEAGRDAGPPGACCVGRRARRSAAMGTRPRSPRCRPRRPADGAWACGVPGPGVRRRRRRRGGGGSAARAHWRGHARCAGVVGPVEVGVDGRCGGGDDGPRDSLPAPGCFINVLIRSTIAGSRLARALTLTSRPSSGSVPAAPGSSGPALWPARAHASTKATPPDHDPGLAGPFSSRPGLGPCCGSSARSSQSRCFPNSHAGRRDEIDSEPDRPSGRRYRSERASSVRRPSPGRGPRLGR